jgi:hypothetical protein
MSTIDVSKRAVRSDIPEHLIWRHSFAAFTSELDDPYVAVGRHSEVHANPHVIGYRSQVAPYHLGHRRSHLPRHAPRRREITIVVEEFVQRCRNLRMAAGESNRFNTHINFAVAYLPLQWDHA